MGAGELLDDLRRASEPTLQAPINHARAFATAFTTITSFPAIASFADSDRTALAVAKSPPTQVAAL